ncbi:MAG: aminodeoxychorismate/anthranilate synthase component II [Saprospiraceae bacterium]|nr:aminodeoxychorismate/anthranilate synthase component II [Saprospiraceae bacterium]
MRTLVLDNYDSFTYNLVQYIQEILGKKIDVFRNDAITLEAVGAYDILVLSPGPGLPSEAGIMPEIIAEYGASKKIFGVCLGHQAIGEAFGGTLLNLTKVYHGLQSSVSVIEPDDVLFSDIPSSFEAGRYHSWVVDRNSLPAALEITAVDDKNVIMAMRHRDYDIWGVQFHPESIMTRQGLKMLENFFSYCGATVKDRPAKPVKMPPVENL